MKFTYTCNRSFSFKILLLGVGIKEDGMCVLMYVKRLHGSVCRYCVIKFSSNGIRCSHDKVFRWRIGATRKGVAYVAYIKWKSIKNALLKFLYLLDVCFHLHGRALLHWKLSLTQQAIHYFLVSNHLVDINDETIKKLTLINIPSRVMRLPSVAFSKKTTPLFSISPTIVIDP